MSFLRAVSVNAAATGLTFAIGFAAQAWIARGLGPGGRGQLALAITSVMIGSLVLGEWLARGSGYVSGRHPDKVGSAWSNCFGYCAALLVLLLLVASVAPGLVVGASTSTQALVVAAMVGFVVAQKGFAGILQGSDRLTEFALVPLLFVCVFFVLSLVALSWWQAGLDGVLLAWLAGAGLAAGFAAVRSRTAGPLAPALLRQTATIGGRGAVSATLIYLLFRSDVFLVERFLGAEQLGVYAIAVVIAEMMQRGPNIAGAVLLPKVLRGGDDDHGTSLVVGRWVLGFSLLGALGVILIGGIFIDMAFGLDYSAAHTPLLWMLPGLVAAGFASVLNTKLAGLGYPAVTLWAPAVALVTNIGLNLIWIPRYGLIGAAQSTSVAYVLWAVLVTIAYRQHTGVAWTRLVRS